MFKKGCCANDDDDDDDDSGDGDYGDGSDDDDDGDYDGDDDDKDKQIWNAPAKLSRVTKLTTFSSSALCYGVFRYSDNIQPAPRNSEVQKLPDPYASSHRT